MLKANALAHGCKNLVFLRLESHGPEWQGGNHAPEFHNLTSRSRRHDAVRLIMKDPEWTYRYEERLAILTDGKEPTPQQIRIAKDEADEAVKKLNEILTQQ